LEGGMSYCLPGCSPWGDPGWTCLAVVLPGPWDPVIAGLVLIGGPGLVQQFVQHLYSLCDLPPPCLLIGMLLAVICF
jgi:hypothetical protein